MKSLEYLDSVSYLPIIYALYFEHFIPSKYDFDLDFL